MRIAINTRLVIPNKLDGIGWYSFEVSKRLAELHPEHQFLWVFDRQYDEKLVTLPNVQAKVVYPSARHPLLYRMYFEYSLPLVLRSWKADLFFSPDGFLSSRVRVPQIPVIHDLNFEHRPDDLPKNYSQYYRTNFPRFARMAKEILTVSDFSATDIAATYDIDRSKIHVAHNGANEAFVPSTAEEQAETRLKLARGKEYFLFVGSFSARKNVHGLINAFNRYKQLGGNFSLMLVGDSLWKYDEMERALSQSAYAAEILFPGHLNTEELNRALGAAAALVFPSFFEGFGIPVVEAFRTRTPVITSNVTSLPEIAGDAAVLCAPGDTDALADLMIEREANPQKYFELSEKGFERGTRYTWQQCAEKVSGVLMANL